MTMLNSKECLLKLCLSTFFSFWNSTNIFNLLQLFFLNKGNQAFYLGVNFYLFPGSAVNILFLTFVYKSSLTITAD
jgi:hypothetical protein